MKFYFADKSYSWLQWPVKLKSCKEEKLHITAKFFGETNININVAEAMLNRLPSLENHIEQSRGYSYSWKPEIFDGDTHVLVLNKCPVLIHQVNDLFALIRDDWPTFQPHITVPMNYWDLVKANDLTPLDENLEVGEIELWKSKLKIEQGD